MRTRARTAVVLAVVGAGIGAFLLVPRPSEVTRDARRPECAAVGMSAPPELAAPPLTPSRPAPKERVWWFDGSVRRANAAITSARIEVAWWSSRPSPPYATPDALFLSDEVDVSTGRGSYRVTGNGMPGWAVLYVVAGGVRSLAYPFWANPVEAVLPGFGQRRDGNPLNEPVAGARELVVCALDRQGAPVEGLEIDARVRDTDRLQRRWTDAEGRALFSGFPSPEAVLSWRRSRASDAGEVDESLANEFADGPARLVTWSDVPEAVIRIARNPRVSLRVRIAGAPPDAYCPIGGVRVANAPGQGIAHDAAHGFFVPPGAWRCATYVHGAGDIVVETPSLTLDTEVQLDVPAELSAGTPWLDVSFDVGGTPTVNPIACAIDAQEKRGGMTQGTVPFDRIVIPLPPGTYEVTGAVRIGGAVRISAPSRTFVGPRDRVSIILKTSPAGGIRAPSTAPEKWNDSLALLEREFPNGPVIEATGFRFGWLSNRNRPTIWWLPSGRWTLVRRAHDKSEIRSWISLDVKPDRIVRVRDGVFGLELDDD